MKYRFSFVLLASALSGNCQEKIFDYPLSAYEAGFVKLNVIPSSDSSFHLSFFLKENIRRFSINSSTTADILQTNSDSNTKQFGLLVPTESKILHQVYKDEYLGGTRTEKNIEEFFFNSNKNKVSLLETEIAEHSVRLNELASFTEDEVLLTVFSQQNVFYIITYIKETNRVNLYKKKMGSPLGILRSSIILPDRIGAIKENKLSPRLKKFSDIFSASYFVFENGGSYPLAASNYPVKIFIQQGRIIISIDVEPVYHLLNLDLSDLSYSFRKFDFSAIATTKPGGYNHSGAWVLDSSLVVASAPRSRLFLYSFNINTGELQKTFTIPIPDSLHILKADFISASLTLQKNSHGDIYVTAALNTTELKYNPFLSIITSGAGTFLINSIPNVFGFALLSWYKEEEHAMQISCSLTGDDLQIKEPQGKGDILDKFMEEQKVDPKNCFLYASGKFNFLGLYNAHTGIYSIYKFPNN